MARSMYGKMLTVKYTCQIHISSLQFLKKSSCIFQNFHNKMIGKQIYLLILPIIHEFTSCICPKNCFLRHVILFVCLFFLAVEKERGWLKLWKDIEPS